MIGFHFIASPHIGSGHARRCAVLANKLVHLGHEILLITDGDTTEFVKGFWPDISRTLTCDNSSSGLIEAVKTLRLDLFVVDRYDLSLEFETAVAPFTDKLMIIDDLPGRFHQCDFLLDQNPGRSIKDWDYLEETGATVLAGSHYALLRDEFYQMRREKEDRLHCPQSDMTVFICFGGGDDVGITNWAAQSLLPEMSPSIQCHVAVGSGAKNLIELVKLQDAYGNLTVHVDCTDMARLMANADISLGAPGSMTMERSCLSLPAILISFADNQLIVGPEVNRLGAAIYLGEFSQINKKQLINAFRQLETNHELRHDMALKASRLTDGLGAGRVIEALSLTEPT